MGDKQVQVVGYNRHEKPEHQSFFLEMNKETAQLILGLVHSNYGYMPWSKAKLAIKVRSVLMKLGLKPSSNDYYGFKPNGGYYKNYNPPPLEPIIGKLLSIPTKLSDDKTPHKSSFETDHVPHTNC